MATKKAAAPVSAPAKRPASPPAQPTTALAVRATAAVAKPNQDTSNLLGQYSGAGMENITADEMAIPRITLLQKDSPLVDKSDKAYVEGAQAGMFYENVTGKLWNGQTGFDAIFVNYRKEFVEWWPRNSKAGKGMVGTHGANPKIIEGLESSAAHVWATKKGTEIVATHEYFALVLNEKLEFQRALMSFAKSQYHKGKKLNSLLDNMQIEVPGPNGGMVTRVAPMFFRVFHITSVPEENEKGKWIGYSIEYGPALLPSSLKEVEVLEGGEELFKIAASFYESTRSGKVKVADPVVDGTGESSTGRRNREDDSAPM